MARLYCIIVFIFNYFIIEYFFCCFFLLIVKRDGGIQIQFGRDLINTYGIGVYASARAGV